MSINIYDGNNVRLREMTKTAMPGQSRLGLRGTYETQMMDGHTHIWVWDGKDHNLRRRELYPPYKMNREPMSEDHFSQIKLFKELMTHSSATQVTVPGWEADDVVGVLAREFAARGHQVVCHTNDLDYLQLTNNPNITINGIQKTPVAARWVNLYKACCGDSSDNIAGIPGCGGKTWDALAPHAAELEQTIKERGDFSRFPFRPQSHRWLSDPENVELVRTMLYITYFLPVPKDEIEKHMIIGRPNRAAADELLNRYFL
jgi:hypothetical protein